MLHSYKYMYSFLALPLQRNVDVPPTYDDDEQASKQASKP
jgi:hypothetical protein